jgi:uncharacterized protein RhaS with RHS repeats
VLNLPQDGGQLAAQTFHRATIDDYNHAVATLQSAGHDEADQQARAAADAAEQAQQAKDQGSLQSALDTLREDADFSAALTELAGGVKKVDADLAQLRVDAAKGQGDDCDNVLTGVTYDAQQNVEYDANQEVGYDLTVNLGPAIETARQDITALQAAAARVRADGLPVTVDVTTVISAARAAISKAISKANKAADQANADVASAYAIARGMATGACADDGPDGSPDTVAHLH